MLDLYDRKVVAYKISKFNNINLVIYTLKEAIAKRKDVRNLIIHSDQGFQYTSFEYKAICESNGIQRSMSRKGTPGKGICQPCLFNLHAEYTMQNVGLGEVHRGIKIARRNINNLRYANDIPL